jgi:hypothetical protein
MAVRQLLRAAEHKAPQTATFKTSAAPNKYHYVSDAS